MSPLRGILLSPGFAFVAGCLAFPWLLEQIIPIGEPLGSAFLMAWPVLLWSSVGVAVVLLTFSGPCMELTRNDAWVASWYLANGFFFNSMMDVFAGQFQSWQASCPQCGCRFDC